MSSAKPPPDLEVTDLEKRVGKITALRPTSFTVARGGTVGVTGKGGTGKSTLISILAGLVRPSAGCATVLGAKPGAARHRGAVGTFLQRAALPSRESVSEFLTSLSLLQGVKPSVTLPPLIELLKLQNAIDRSCDQISASEVKLVGVAAALLGKPRVLLLDEPTLGLPPREAVLVRTALYEFGSQSAIVLVSTDSHDLEMCDDLVTLSELHAEEPQSMRFAARARVRAPKASTSSANAPNNSDFVAGKISQ